MSYRVKIIETTLAGECANAELEQALEKMLDKVSVEDAKKLLKAAADKPQLIKTALKFI